MRYLKEGETAALIRIGNVLELEFGIGWVRLKDVPENAWAFKELEKLDGQSKDYVIAEREENETSFN